MIELFFLFVKFALLVTGVTMIAKMAPRQIVIGFTCVILAVYMSGIEWGISSDSPWEYLLFQATDSQRVDVLIHAGLFVFGVVFLAIYIMRVLSKEFGSDRTQGGQKS
jgi:hypothetical protein